jgi:hypothetical protein
MPCRHKSVHPPSRDRKPRRDVLTDANIASTAAWRAVAVRLTPLRESTVRRKRAISGLEMRPSWSRSMMLKIIASFSDCRPRITSTSTEMNSFMSTWLRGEAAGSATGGGRGWVRRVEGPNRVCQRIGSHPEVGEAGT